MIIVEQSLLNHKTLMTQFVLINFLTLSHIFSLLFLHRRPRTKKEKCRYYTFLQQRHLCLTNIFCLHATLFILEYITHHAIHYFLSIYFTYISDRQQEILSEKMLTFYLLRYIIEKEAVFTTCLPCILEWGTCFLFCF